jgi:NAD-dependent dihydropyrimidine dehydrogenase PreA subunit
MTFVVAEPCVDVLDRSCVDVCPVDCIYEGGRMAFIQPEECIDCGACVQVCPMDAIFHEDDLPEEWSPFTQHNAEFFATVGSPGGTENLPPGRVPDPVAVTALPPRPAEE